MSGLSSQSHISLVDPSSFWLPDGRLLPDGQFGALQPLHYACCVVFPSFSFAPEKPKRTSHAILFSPTILTKCIPLLRGLGCHGNREHQAVERRFQDSEQAPCPTPNPPMLFTSESSWASRNHNDLIGLACFKLLMSPLSSILEPLLTGRKRKEGKPEKEKRTHRILYLPLHFLKFWSHRKKSE